MLICLKKFSSLRSVNAALSRCSLAALVTATPLTVNPSLAALLVCGGAVKGHLDTAEVPLLNSNGQSAGAGEGKVWDGREAGLGMVQ